MVNNRDKRVGAFTFIELLIAFTIFSIIAASIYYTLGTGIKLYSKGNFIIEDNQRLRIFFDTVSSDLRNALNYYPYLGSDWQSDSITFIAIIDIFDKGHLNEELAKLKYFLDEGKLIRKCATLKEGFKEDKAESQVLLENVKSLSFQYCYEKVGFEDEYEWIGKWEFEGREVKIPKGVKIKLTLGKEGQESSESFTKTVFIPLGEIGSRVGG